MSRSVIPSTTRQRPTRAILHCAVCEQDHVRDLPDVDPEDGWNHFVWVMNDFWPRCCGTDLRLMETISPS